MNAIFTRRSVRQFSNQYVEPEKIEQLLRAAMQAPSAANGQPWEFLVVRGKDNLNALSQFNQYASCLKNADVGIIVLGNRSKMVLPDHWEQDLGAVTQNIMLEAVEQDLGTVWFGTAPDKTRMDYIRNLYGLNDNLMPYSVIAVGYPKDPTANRFTDRFDESRIRYINE